jgi:hypothetical protein
MSSVGHLLFSTFLFVLDFKLNPICSHHELTDNRVRKFRKTNLENAVKFSGPPLGLDIGSISEYGKNLIYCNFNYERTPPYLIFSDTTTTDLSV